MDSPTPCIPLAPINPIQSLNAILGSHDQAFNLSIRFTSGGNIFSPVCRFLKNWALAVMLSQMDFLIASSVDQDKVKGRSELNELTFPCLLHRK